MKKIVALLISIAMICCLSVTAFAAESPVANEKITITLKKASAEGTVSKNDVDYTVDKGYEITVKANSEFGKFNSWSIYKVEASVENTSVASESGVITLNSVVNLAATTKVTEAVAGTDYEIVKGSLTSDEMTVKVNSSVIICGNYDNVKTDPLSSSNSDNSASAPQTGDLTLVYAFVVALAALTCGFGIKKVYSK